MTFMNDLFIPDLGFQFSPGLDAATEAALLQSLTSSLPAERGDVAWSEPRLWWSLAFISIVGSALATVAYLSALRVIDATRASTWLFMAPVIAVVLDARAGTWVGRLEVD